MNLSFSEDFKIQNYIRIKAYITTKTVKNEIRRCRGKPTTCLETSSKTRALP